MVQKDTLPTTARAAYARGEWNSAHHDFSHARSLGDLVIASGWASRANRILKDLPEGPEHGYLMYLDAAIGLGMMGDVEQKIVERFRHGGGLSYADYPNFHQTMAEESAAVNDAWLIDVILPLVDGLPGRLTPGIDVARWDAVGQFDAATAFDAIHDQAHPAQVLDNIHRALRPGGVFLMVDIKAESKVEDNITLPWASYLYAMSMFHCMSVSLGLDGDGLGTAWGRQVAERMVSEAGFATVDAKDIDSDPFNTYYVARRS